MDRRVFALMGLAVMLSSPLQMSAEQSGGKLQVPVAGTVTPKTGPGVGVPVAVTGTFTIHKFDLIDKEVRAVGVLTLPNPATGTVNVIATSIPLVLKQTGTGSASKSDIVSAAEVTPAATCEILNLTLGPLNLDLLGLVVNLNQVVLNISAESGPGNLLGNLLCAVANLLNGLNLSALLQQIVNILNQILNAL